MNKTIASGRLKNENFFCFKVLHSKAFLPFNANLAESRAKDTCRPPPQFPFCKWHLPPLQYFYPSNKRSETMKKSLMAAAIVSLVLTACSGGKETAAESSASQTQTSSSQTDKLNIYNWSDYVDPATLSAFEKNTHINVRYDYYDSNEALEAKLLTGKSGYDLVAPSIANVGRQIKAGAYQKIDKSQIPDYANIDPDLLKMMEAVDPGNEYAVPYFWGINTLAINKQQVQKALGTDKLPENEWDLVFNPEYTQKLKSCGISYFDSAIEQIPLALHYLGKDPNSENPDDIKAAVDMMKKCVPTSNALPHPAISTIWLPVIFAYR